MNDLTLHINIAQLLHKNAATKPESIAIIDTHRGRRRMLSFAELELASARAAALLSGAGLSPGDAVLVFQPMSAELYIALAAIFRLGLVAMFLDPGQGRKHIEQCCAIQRPKALIAGAKAHLLRLISPALRCIPHKFTLGFPLPGATSWQQAARLTPHYDIFPCAPDTPALLTFTSGSTGQPKAALRTHAFLLAQHRVLAGSLMLTAGQLDMATMPIVMLANLASGVTSLIPKADLRYPGAIDPAPIVEQIKTFRVESAVASPALLDRLAQQCLSRQMTLPSLKKIFTGGAPVFPRLLGQLQQIAPEADIVAVYGSTEAEPMAKIAWSQITAEDDRAMRHGRGLLVGAPVEAINLRVIQDRWGDPIGPYTKAQFDAICCSSHESGEIVVSGDHVLSGYLDGRGDTETKFKVEETTWHRTGDAGYLDEQGRLWLLGRCAARIEDEHGRLHPFAAECVLSFLPQIRRSAVVLHNRRRILALQFYPGAPKPDLSAVKEALGWTHVDEIRVYSHIPVDKRHNAKIDYQNLNRLLTKSGKTL